jgi:hypothetical protein
VSPSMMGLSIGSSSGRSASRTLCRELEASTRLKTRGTSFSGNA